MWLMLLLLVIFISCLALQLKGGLWSNTLTLINVILSGLLAFNFFEPLAAYLSEQAPSFQYLWDFVSLWLIFILSMALLRATADFLSNVKVRFRLPVDLVGGILMAVCTGWVMICFTTATLHTAPLARNSWGGTFQETPTSRMFFGLAPDLKWLSFAYYESRGPLYRGQPLDNPYAFVLRYGNRRAEFEKEPGTLTNKKK